jgi:hypothetical protein
VCECVSECVCLCENECEREPTPKKTIVVRGDHLRDGSTLSCGCAQRKIKKSASQRLKKTSDSRTSARYSCSAQQESTWDASKSTLHVGADTAGLGACNAHPNYYARTSAVAIACL